jgi:hypothetical protein
MNLRMQPARKVFPLTSPKGGEGRLSAGAILSAIALAEAEAEAEAEVEGEEAHYSFSPVKYAMARGRSIRVHPCSSVVNDPRP